MEYGSDKGALKESDLKVLVPGEHLAWERYSNTPCPNKWQKIVEVDGTSGVRTVCLGCTKDHYIKVGDRIGYYGDENKSTGSTARAKKRDKLAAQNTLTINTTIMSNSTTTNTSEGAPVFTTKVIETIDGYVGQVFATLPGTTQIVWQGQPIEAGEFDEKENDHSGRVAARKEAEEAVKTAVKGLFSGSNA